MPTQLEIDPGPLLEGIEKGQGLPSSWYTDPNIFQAETERVLRKSWHFGTHSGMLEQPGDTVVKDVAGIPVVFTRSGDGEIRGFVNICRHRAHPVVIEGGHRKRETMQCLYHGWTYDFEGSLLRAPRAEYEHEAFDKSVCGLVPVRTHVWGPTVWVCPDLEAPDFVEWTSGLQELVASHDVDVEDHVFAFERNFEIRANWKVFLDNAIECYHCPTCHSQLSTVLVMNPHRHEISVGNSQWSTQNIPFKNEDRLYHFNWIFPTTYFQYAGAGFDVGAIEPVDVDHIRFRSLTFVPKATSPAEISEREAKLDNDPTISEDVAICERVQQAHEVGIAPPGQLLPESEKLLLHYERTIVQMMAAG